MGEYLWDRKALILQIADIQLTDAVVETLHFSDEEYANEDYSYNLEDPHD